MVNGRKSLIEELKSQDDPLRKFIAIGFNELISDSRFLDALPGLIEQDPGSRQRLSGLVSIIRKISQL